MKDGRPSILIYNPISGHGHLDSWNALFVSLLLERGYRILVLTPDRHSLQSHLAQRKLTDHPRLRVLDWEGAHRRLSLIRLWNYIRRIWKIWLAHGENYTQKLPESRITPGMQSHVRMRKRIFQIIVPPLYWPSRVVHLLYQQVARAILQDGDSENPSEIHHLRPVDTARRINEALKKSPWRPGGVFNMYLDMYKTGVNPWRKFAAVCRLPWGGIKFVPSEAPLGEGYFTLPSFRGMCFLDESICKAYSTSLPDKYFQYLPDVTNVDLTEGPCPLAEDVRFRAAERKIVFLGGCIGGQKNIARWCELITLADPKRWFFVQVGEIHVGTFSPEDKAAFERLTKTPPENLLLHTQYVSDEREFNAVIRVADILFAVYRNFRISSNMLGKAGYFEKPILVSDGFLVAERVRRYGIGIVVPQDDVQAMLGALERLAAEPVPPENFAKYRRDFNEQVAGDCLENFLNHVLAG